MARGAGHDAWVRGFGFDRSIRSKDGAKRVLGVGHKLVNQALRQAKSADVSVATLSTRVLKRPLLIFRITDRVTGEERNVRSVVAGVEIGVGVDGQGLFLRDSELLERLNAATGGCPIKPKDSPAPAELQIVASAIQTADAVVRQKLHELALPFKVPEVEPVAVLWPIVPDDRESEIEGETEEREPD